MPCPGEAAVGKLEDDAASLPGGGGEFRCLASYPAAARSLELGRQNLHLFRLKNTRFDFIGGGLYFLIVVRLVLASVLEGRSAHVFQGRRLSSFPPRADSFSGTPAGCISEVELFIARCTHWSGAVGSCVSSCAPTPAALSLPPM